MKTWTWTEILARIKAEMSLDDSDGLVTDAELLDYANDAIDDAESEIMGIKEDYFLTKDTMTLVVGTEEYAMPSDIYANKLRGVVYFKGTEVYPVTRVKDWNKFLEYRYSKTWASSTWRYKYMLLNTTPGSPKMLLSPPAQEAGAVIERWYIRNANRLTTGADKLDIPEFIQFILSYIKNEVYAKDGHPLYAKSSEAVAMWRAKMIDTLTDMVQDGDNEIEPDFSHYEEST
jgi:hypothetical protein